ncbi:unnamed protein product [Meganyctiphanes norvegica]|uniref:SCP domain-containing protein n=1 Tax=Meganyctiphanes norvegica TaxID=48144 RepID=A0AAV2QJM4_MEGNR
MGQEIRGDPGPQPAGSNIREMVWNDELANVAQAWGNQCPRGRDCLPCRTLCSRDYVVGQNIFFAGAHNEEQMWSEAVEGWSEWVKDFNSSMVEKLAQSKPGSRSFIYTQLVWAETYEVGCGAIYFPMVVPQSDGSEKTYKASRIYLCNYGPTGNYLNRPVYRIGEAATECPNGVSNTYPALCA